MEKDVINICPVPAGKLLIIGGAENKGADHAEKKETPSNFETLQILKAFVELTGKKDPAIEIITSASEDGEESFRDYQDAFRKLVDKDVGHIHHVNRKSVLDDSELIDRLMKADAIFFAGGSQLKYTHLYGGTPFLTSLKERYIKENIVIAGTSAGAMAMSTPMIYAGNQEIQEIGGMIKVTTGLEFLKDVCIDTHFVQRGRVVRMAQVIVANPGCIGFGIEEDTALIISSGLKAKVIGTGTVIILEGFEITDANINDFTSRKPITIRDLKMHILSDGEEYEIVQMNPPHY